MPPPSAARRPSRHLLSRRHPDQTIKDLCAAYLEGRLPVDRLISKRVGIEHTRLALDAMLTGAEGRAVILFDRADPEREGLTSAQR